MGKAAISIGDDTPTGEPGNAPEGPYITAADDGTRPRKSRKTPEGKSPTPTKAPSARPNRAVRTDY